MPNPGDIFLYRDFQFEDGSTQDKIFVVLNSCNLDDPCLFLKTTSKSRRYQGCSLGCNKNKNCFFVSHDWQPSFDLNTYIQLPEIFSIKTDLLLKKIYRKEIEFFPTSLSHDCFSQLLSCLFRYNEDIDDNFRKLIFKKTAP